MPRESKDTTHKTEPKSSVQGSAGSVGLQALRSSVEAYYTRKVRDHGATALGVDWPSVPSLELRLVQLLKVCDFTSPMSLNDLGCGYGAALSLLGRRHKKAQIDYEGVDISSAMVEHACLQWAGRPLTRFVVGHQSTRIADYSIASGVFNVRLNNGNAIWEEHIRQTIANLHRTSRKGFAVNFMLPGSDYAQIPELYCAEPQVWANYCQSEFDRPVEIFSNYGLPEYSLLVR